MVEDCLCTVLGGQAVPWSEVGVSTASLLATSDALEVSELLHYRLAEYSRSHGWPANVRFQLAQRAHTSAARQLVRAAETADVLQALARRGLRPIVFKGAALSHLVYDSAALRPHSDTDLLVRRSDVEVVRRVLTARGYSEPPMTAGELVFCQFQMVRTDDLGIQHVFDVHWKISTQTLFADVLTFDELDAEAVPIEPLGADARGAGWVHALLLACIHPVMHHRNVERLIWLYDIHLLANRLPTDDIDRFTTLAIGKRVAGICARQLRRASERFHTRLAPDLVRALSAESDRERSAVYLRSGRRWHHEMMSNVRHLERWRDRARLMREVLFPSARYMLDTYHLGASGVVLLPALYVHRTVHGAFKILVGQK
jgi:putative nucleotidyltransferase-like protein